MPPACEASGPPGQTGPWKLVKLLGFFLGVLTEHQAVQALRQSLNGKLPVDGMVARMIAVLFIITRTMVVERKTSKTTIFVIVLADKIRSRTLHS